MNIPLHPLLVHFPIALLYSALAVEIAGFILKKEGLRNAVAPMLVLASLGALAAVITGLIAHEQLGKMSTEVHELIETHELFAFLTLGFCLASALIRIVAHVKGIASGKIALIGFVLLVLACVLAGITGYFGGEIVFKHGAGTAIYEEYLRCIGGGLESHSH